jgi:hypothetical protein
LKNQSKEYEATIFPAIPITEVVIDGMTVPLPVHWQISQVIGKMQKFSDDSLTIGYYIFERAIKKMKEFFSSSEIKFIYIPSVLASYKLISPTASLLGRSGAWLIIDTELLVQSHFEVCKEIQKISQKLKIPFFDTSMYLRATSSKGYIRGPKDWRHLNESGYKALSSSISEFLLYPDKPYQNCTN